MKSRTSTDPTFGVTSYFIGIQRVPLREASLLLTFSVTAGSLHVLLLSAKPEVFLKLRSLVLLKPSEWETIFPLFLEL